MFGDGIDWAFEASRAAAADDARGPGIERSELVDRLAVLVPRRGRVLDAGCNIGRYAPSLMAAGFDYTGVDQSVEALEIARQRNPRAAFVHSFLWDMAFSQPFDAAVCFAVLQHNTQEEKERIAPRIAAAIRPGGALLLSESTLPEATPTQLTRDGWIALITRHGFALVETFHPNEYGLHDGYAFTKMAGR